MIFYFTHATPHPLLHKWEGEKSQNICPMPTSDSWTKSCSFCGSLGKGRGPVLSNGPSCLLNCPLWFITRQAADVDSGESLGCVLALSFVSVLPVCLDQKATRHVYVCALCSTHQLWMLMERGWLVTVLIWVITFGAQSQGSFSVLGYRYVCPAEEEETQVMGNCRSRYRDSQFKMLFS